MSSNTSTPSDGPDGSATAGGPRVVATPDTGLNRTAHNVTVV